MKKLLFFLVLTGFSLIGQNSELDFDIDCGTEMVPDFINISKGTNSSTNGYYFTPKGDIRVLVIYVDFENPKNEDRPLDSWPQGQMFPTDHINNNGDVVWGHKNFNEFTAIGNPVGDERKNVSEFFYHMSNGDLRVYFETLRDPLTGQATSVVVNPVDPNNPNNFLNRSQVNALVANKISTLYPQNWSRFDIRPNTPFWSYDASATLDCLDTDPPGCESNNIIDYAILIYRNQKGWDKPILTEAGNGESGIFQLNLNNGYSTRPGVSIHNFGSSLWSFLSITIHEICHGYIYMPHVATANTVHGKYMFSNYGESAMINYGLLKSLMNSWERWFSGWNDITYDLDPSLTNSTNFVLRDYMKYSESMRIKFPHTTNQYIWLEHHSNNTNSFYNRNAYVTDAFGNIIPYQTPGIYGFVERISNDTLTLNHWNNGKNGIKVINGRGNYDFKFEGFHNRSYYWNNAVMKVKRLGENPYGAHHESSWFRHDFNNDNQIGYTSGESSNNEGNFIMEIDDEVVWGQFAPNVKLPEKKLSAFTNPALTNFQEINVSLKTLSPIVLHSLSITPSHSITNLNDMNILVNYNDGHIEDDFRMTGKIYLPSNEDIILNSSKALTLNRSKTPNILQEENNSFSDYSVFITAEDGSLTGKSSSKIILDESTTMIFEGGSELKLETKAKLYIRNGSLLCIKEGTSVNLGSLAQIIVEDGFLQVHPSINISGNVFYTNEHYGLPTIFSTLNYCTVGSNPEYLHSIGGTYVSGSNCLGSSFSLSNTDKVKLTSETFIQMDSNFEVPNGAIFDAEIMKIADDCDIEFWFGTNGDPNNIPKGYGKSSTEEAQKTEPPFEISVYPNPSNGSFNVQINKELSSLNYQLFDFYGNKIIESNEEKTSLFSVSYNNLQSGIYIIKVINNEYTANAKVIIY
ncbi:T9SS type A sorting domain-containing protein [Xanthomarina gelatinilytica]|uniref:T9SS type A sorting domain-containing protein n=1 Tax=Xanthomarina gelatinilytica TaxID=1137281 RepID=UPI003AA7E3B3